MLFVALSLPDGFYLPTLTIRKARTELCSPKTSPFPKIMFVQPPLYEPEPPPVLLASRFFVESPFSEQSTGARLKVCRFF